MRSLNGYLKKIYQFFKPLFFTFSVVLLVFSVIGSSIFAQEELDQIKIHTASTYTISSNRTLTANIQLYLINESNSPTIIKSYTLKLPFTKVGSISVRNGGKTLTSSIKEVGKSSELTISIDNEPLYASKTLTLSINFERKDFISPDMMGQDITVPISIEGTINDKTTVHLDREFGDIKYLLGANGKISRTNSNVTASISNPTSESVTLVLNSLSSYTFTIKKRLENSGDQEIIKEVPIIKDTHNQEVTFSTISPSPKMSYLDNSDNTIMAYQIAPNSYIDITIEGSINYITTWPEQLLYPEINNYLDKTSLWEINNLEGLNSFDTYLKSNGVNVKASNSLSNQISDQSEREYFYKLTYQFTKKQLTHSKGNQGGLALPSRSGATNLISGNSNASIEDYSDLMIGLLREYGVPSRMAIGYVTNITELYEGDFVHSWVEIWDPQSGWIVADPALDELVNKEMFKISPLDHITILHRVTSPSTPNLISSEPDSILFQEGDKSESDESTLNFEVTSFFNKNSKAIENPSGEIIVKNLGNKVIQQLDIEEKISHTKGGIENRAIIVPGQSTTIPFQVNMSRETVVKNGSGEIELLFAISARNGGDQINVLHSTTASVSSLWWWKIFIQTISTTIFLTILFALYNIYKKFMKSESLLSKLIERYI